MPSVLVTTIHGWSGYSVQTPKSMKEVCRVEPGKKDEGDEKALEQLTKFAKLALGAMIVGPQTVLEIGFAGSGWGASQCSRPSGNVTVCSQGWCRSAKMPKREQSLAVELGLPIGAVSFKWWLPERVTGEKSTEGSSNTYEHSVQLKNMSEEEALKFVIYSFAQPHSSFTLHPLVLQLDRECWSFPGAPGQETGFFLQPKSHPQSWLSCSCDYNRPLQCEAAFGRKCMQMLGRTWSRRRNPRARRRSRHGKGILRVPAVGRRHKCLCLCLLRWRPRQGGS